MEIHNSNEAILASGDIWRENESSCKLKRKSEVMDPPVEPPKKRKIHRYFSKYLYTLMYFHKGRFICILIRDYDYPEMVTVCDQINSTFKRSGKTDSVFCMGANYYDDRKNTNQIPNRINIHAIIEDETKCIYMDACPYGRNDLDRACMLELQHKSNSRTRSRIIRLDCIPFDKISLLQIEDTKEIDDILLKLNTIK